MSHIVAPSILSADFGKLNEAFEMINQSRADWFHVDVMDGVFVPNISFGFPVMKSLKKVAKKPLDVHLMIVQPERYIEDFAKAGANILTVHYEACTHLHRTLAAIKEAGMKAGVAINPHTPISFLKDILYITDLVCMMSVNPGFGGQKFIENTYSKIKELKAMADSQNLQPYIEIDGGVTLSNAKSLIEAGANALVAGNTVFSAANPMEAIEALKNF
ncbi:MAG: ribulose-phosphate 3-epimerase [Bacteroidetes bacterium]|nr:ribulose-phosphate 3-epimerase [Bacteroidota bacterium]